MLLKEPCVKYENGRIDEFIVNPDKVCYWDLLGDVKELVYNIEKSISPFYVEDGGTLKLVFDDDSTNGLSEQVGKNMIVDVYVETSYVDHGRSLPDALLSNEFNDGTELSKDNEEEFVEVSFVNYASDADDKKEEARDKLMMCLVKMENKRE